MPIDIFRIENDKILVLEYSSMIRYEQVKETFERIAALEEVGYMMVIGSEMMMERPDLFEPEELGALVFATVSKESFRCIVEVSPEDHPIREMSQRGYDEMGLRHKVRYAETKDDALSILRALIAEDHNQPPPQSAL